LSDTSITTYQLFKDFAGPAAVVIGALAAGCFTVVISNGQKRIAQSQRDIALDQLKFDLLQRRYEVYQATKELLEYVPFISDIEKSDTNKLRTLAVKIDEARFYFPPDVCQFLHDTRARCETFLARLGQRDLLSVDDQEQ
jgi:hypothetical protein